MTKVYCAICNKRIRRVEEAEMVQMSTGGRFWTERNAPALPEREDQGWFEVGSDCYRKVNAAGTAGFTR